MKNINVILLFMIHFVSIAQVERAQKVSLYDNFFNPKSFVSYPKYLIDERTPQFKKVAIKSLISQVNYANKLYLFSPKSQKYTSPFGLGYNFYGRKENIINPLGLSNPYEAVIVGAIETLFFLTKKKKKRKSRAVFKSVRTIKK